MAIDVALCHDCNNCFMACKDEHVGNDWPGYTAAQPRHGHRWINIERRERGAVRPQRRGVSADALPALPGRALPEGGARRRHHPSRRHRDDRSGKGQGQQGPGRFLPLRRDLLERGSRTSRRSAPCAPTCWTTRTGSRACPAASTPAPPAPWSSTTWSRRSSRSCAKQEGFEGYRSAELKNQPQVVYKNLFKYTKNFITAGVLVNGDCFENATVTLKNKTGVLATQKTNFFGEFKFDGSGERRVHGRCGRGREEDLLHGRRSTMSPRTWALSSCNAVPSQLGA